MRIAIISAWYPSEKSPFYGVFIKHQAEQLAQTMDVSVFLLKRSILPYTKTYSEKNVEVFEKGRPSPPNLSEVFLKNWANSYASFFQEANQQNTFDLIHAHDHYGAYVAAIIRDKTGIPFITTIHNSSILSGTLAGWKKKYISRVLSKSSKVIAVGRSLSEVLKKDYLIQEVSTLPNFIDTELFKPTRSKDDEAFRFIYVGDLIPLKGIKEMLEAFVELDIGYTELHIIGVGDLKRYIENFIKKSEMSRRIFFHGGQANHDLPKFYNNCHAYLSLSTKETFGVTVVEALSCGLPVIYTRSGGPEHNVGPYGSIEVHPRSIPNIVDAMRQMIDNYLNIDRDKIRKHALKNFSSSSLVEQLTDLYKSTIDEK